MYEQKPGDFSARMRRRAYPISAAGRRRHMGRRAAVLLAAAAVPALAAPHEWDAFTIGSAARAAIAITPMPFEKPGESFPGSAFYYLAPEGPQDGRSTAGAKWNAVLPHSGPAARPLRIGNNGVDRSRAVQCLAAAIYYEAASEPNAGQRAVAQVVLNRVAHPAYPKTVCGVVYQGSERRTGCQFSFTCDGSLARTPMRLFWERAEDVARQALTGQVYVPVGLATHYHTFAVHPYWAPTLTPMGTIGAHRFYRFGGTAGSLGAFRFAYAGGEPLPASYKPRAVEGETIEGAFGIMSGSLETPTPTGSGPGSTRAVPAPTYSAELEQRGGGARFHGEGLPQATGIKPEYQNTGRWIAQPGA